MYDPGAPKTATAVGPPERALNEVHFTLPSPNAPLTPTNRQIKPGTHCLSKIFIYFSATQVDSVIQFYQQNTFRLIGHLCLT